MKTTTMKRIKFNSLWPMATLCLVGVSCSSPSPHDSREPTPLEENRPNIVLVTIDTFRPDHLGFFGYHKVTAPFLESLLARGSVFRRAFSTSSWTAPSTSSLFTSLYPIHHGVTEGFLANLSRTEAQAEMGNEVISLNRFAGRYSHAARAAPGSRVPHTRSGIQHQHWEANWIRQRF